ncbi:MAG: S8 family peptidase [Magnetococcales bacterium]|nr:S8 family peptidase [Magnetococcales bacterium]
MITVNFLIGRGELLTSDIPPVLRGGDKAEVYSLEEAQKRLTPQLIATANEIDQLPSAACPGDYGVVCMTMNPAYIARSYFPTALLRFCGLESVGSRTVKVTPQRWSKKDQPKESSTTELFIVGQRSFFRKMNVWASSLKEGSAPALDLARIERFHAFSSTERIVTLGDSEDGYFEVGIHLIQSEERKFSQGFFIKYAESLGVRAHPRLSFVSGNLWFIAIEGKRKAVTMLAQFALVRVIRPMPRLRSMRPLPRSGEVKIPCALPTLKPLSSEPKVAIIDGGLPKRHPLAAWLGSYRLLDVKASDDPQAPEHGLGVTSAFLFGPITPGNAASQPFSFVDHLRVLDRKTKGEDPFELYRTLGMIEEVLLSRQYQFINLSLGPDLPIEDAEVHAWTAVIDELLSDGEVLMTIAAGNNGDRDRESGNARIQVPSDCVNALCVGACDQLGGVWNRSSYSAVGPGRSPGIIKPDLMAFGGGSSNYFHVISPGERPTLAPQLGTSFAAPFLLRSAVGIRAVLGNQLSSLAIKGLLIHAADPSNHDPHEVGWGKVPEDVMAIIHSPVGVARVVYQGELKPGKFLRAAIPMPIGGLSGNVRLKATFCYASSVDPQDSAAYTRSGLEITFRPHADKIGTNNLGKKKSNADSRSFFKLKRYATELERRSDHGKWETTLHDSNSFRGSSLHKPHFDIHYQAREGGASSRGTEKIPYALILSVEAPRHSNLYNDILKAYPILAAIQPQVTLPINISIGGS